MITRSKLKMTETADLKGLMERMEKTLGDKIDALTQKLAEKDKKIEELQKKVFEFEVKADYTEKRFELLERRLDDYEQYSRRTSLRVNGIPYDQNETAENCLQKVKTEIAKLGVNIENCEFDRAHRIGVSKEGEHKERQMIVKFTTFRARTEVYRNRKREGKIRFYIDQTKRRFTLKRMAMDYVKSKPEVDFVFVDVNCNLCIRFKNNTYKFFNSEEELYKLVGV